MKMKFDKPGSEHQDEIRGKLEHWYNESAQLEDAKVTHFTPPGSGAVNETYLHEVTYRRNGQPASLDAVVRIQPATRNTPIPGVDVNQQAFVLSCLSRLADIPTPAVLWSEPDTRWLGRPFYVMERMRGEANFDAWDIPEDPVSLQSMYRQAIGMIARIHAVDWRRAGLEPLYSGSGDRSPLQAQLDAYRGHLDEASVDKTYPLLESALAYLQDNIPATSAPVLNWGDARIGNMLFDGCELTAVLDWEIAEITAREVDIGWFVFFERFFLEEGSDPRNGAMSQEDITTYYESQAGVKLANLDYFQRWAAFRLAVMRLRAGRFAIQSGAEPAASRVDEVNFGSIEMARVFGYPEPT